MSRTNPNGTRTKRRPTRIAITAVLLGAMLSSTLVANAEEPEPPEPDPAATVATSFRDAKISVVAELAKLADSYSQDQKAGLAGLELQDQKKASHDQKKLEKAIKELNKGLADKYWAADGQTLVGKGEHVFRRDARAIRHLEKIDGDAFDGIIETIMAIDLEMAEAAIAAIPDDADTTKIERTMEKAAEALLKGDLSKAVDLYGTAWRNAARAKPKAPKASTSSAAGGNSFTGSSSNGKYSTYDVVLVRTSTVGSENPEFLSVSGNNRAGTDGYTGKSTEGFLYSDQFGPADTFLDPVMWPNIDGGIMQLHVSCSDVFAGGFGSKSDPAATSQWMINSIHIVKHQGASVDKECEVIGTGLPTPPVTQAPPVSTDPCADMASAPMWCFEDA